MHPKDYLFQLGANVRKSFSQNFLTSPHWVEKMTSAVLEIQPTALWEVGPGLGALTVPLASSGIPLHLFEIDKKLAENLRQVFPKAQMHEGDFLQTPWPHPTPHEKIGFLSNLPYHLSSEILFRLLENKPRFGILVLTFQRELAERLKAKPRSKSYGSLTVLVQLSFSLKSLGIIPPKAFYPPPNVDSEVLTFLPLPTLAEWPLLYQVVKVAFSHRRKKMFSNLKSFLPEEKLTLSFQALKLDTNVRAEELSPDQFLALTKLLI